LYQLVKPPFCSSCFCGYVETIGPTSRPPFFFPFNRKSHLFCSPLVQAVLCLLLSFPNCRTRAPSFFGGLACSFGEFSWSSPYHRDRSKIWYILFEFFPFSTVARLESDPLLSQDRKSLAFPFDSDKQPPSPFYCDLFFAHSFLSLSLNSWKLNFATFSF